MLALIDGQAGAIALGAVALAAAAVVAGAFVPVALRRPESAGGLVERVIGSIARGRIRRWVDPAKIGSLVSTGIAGAAELVGNRRALAAGGAWAIANWLLDFGVFVTLAAAIGGETPLLPLLLLYVIGQLLAAIPITPGGVGVVEGTMTGMLVAGGAPAGAAPASVGSGSFAGWRHARPRDEDAPALGGSSSSRAIFLLLATSGSPVPVPERGELASEAWPRTASCEAPALRYRIRGFT